MSSALYLPEDLFLTESFGELDSTAQLALLGAVCQADSHGRNRVDLPTLATTLQQPLNALKPALDRLASRELLACYQVQEQSYYQVCRWDQWYPNQIETPSTFPASPRPVPSGPFEEGYAEEVAPSTLHPLPMLWLNSQVWHTLDVDTQVLAVGLLALADEQGQNCYEMEDLSLLLGKPESVIVQAIAHLQRAGYLTVEQYEGQPRYQWQPWVTALAETPISLSQGNPHLPNIPQGNPHIPREVLREGELELKRTEDEDEGEENAPTTTQHPPAPTSPPNSLHASRSFAHEQPSPSTAKGRRTSRHKDELAPLNPSSMPEPAALAWTIPQVAHRLHLSRAKVYDLIRHEGLPVTHFGRSVRVKPEDFAEWWRQRDQPTIAPQITPFPTNRLGPSTRLGPTSRPHQDATPGNGAVSRTQRASRTRTG